MAHYVFRLPDVGEGVAEAEIAAWRVKVGDLVAEEQALVDVMTDKATVEMTSPVAGRVVATHGSVGERLAVGAPLAEFETEVAEAPAAPEPELEPEPEPEPAQPSAPVRPPVLAAPATRARAAAAGVRLEEVEGSGPGGRITPADLDRHLAGRPGPPPGGPGAGDGVEEVRIIGLRRQIAERMQEAKRTIPHFGYVEEIDLTELERLRASLNEEAGPERPRLTLLPFLMLAVVRAVRAFPNVNARYDHAAGTLSRYAAVHVGVAVHTPAGLMVPVVRHAEARDLWDCAREMGRLVEAARTGAAKREELTGSTITLTSLGPLGGVAATPIINLPEVAILAPNRIVERPVAQGGGIAVRKMMNLSSAFDHRIVDGHEAASFIRAIKRDLETPARLFLTAESRRGSEG